MQRMESGENDIPGSSQGPAIMLWEYQATPSGDSQNAVTVSAELPGNHLVKEDPGSLRSQTSRWR